MQAYRGKLYCVVAQSQLAQWARARAPLVWGERKLMFYPKNDRLFYLCPGCAAGDVNWCGMKDLQGRKLYVCEKDERHTTTLEHLREASRKRRLLD